ncbi:PBECR4 domain-containing protein [Streptococcus anginosus]|uniref:PBECR4 domain-containing protein n=1 Tax=Streptococcus anginosus TaxID=1328 RepID=UPI00232AA7C6|nr:PBECR4 domain-containing protein [Streptococcus anginosus]MDB8651207.1 PBECR4 domain-containing protein [Streptococcus anginosus]MDB8653715.1 PBECR4 domain-containing protein [Streptococcus anginosus]
MTELESRRGKSRRERVEFARSRDILDIANELQMELVRSGRDYRWKEHDSLVISPDKNLWKWFSRNTGGDAISLVETIKEVDFNQSVDFLNDGNFKEFQMVERPQEDFKYYLEKYEQPFSAGRDYLRNQRGLSDETIDYFLEQGVLAQANAKLNYFAEGNSGSSTNAIEPVIVFKSLSSSGEVFGASLQGIQENWEKWSKHGYAKVIMKNSDPMTGIHVDIGSPKRLIFTESPIDLMSYYELHKDSLQDVRLVSMDGLKESTIGRHLSQIKAEMSGKALIWTPEQLADGLQVAIDRHFFEDGKNADLITLALDNDKAGRTFIQELEAKGAVINSDLPGLRPGQDKTDWNDVLKSQHEEKSYSRKSEYEEMAEATLSESSHFPDTSHLSPEDATWLKENWNNISFSVQSTRPSETDPTTEEKHISGHQESIANTEEDAGRTMSYEEVKRENEALTKKLNNRIQSGELSIEFAPDFYLYDVFAKLGNSHPTKYLNDKRMEALSPIHSLLSSIDDRTVDLYKTKGTPEQDSLYQALKPHQRALGVDISTQFIGELAIAAYNTNKQLESLSSDSFGAYFGERTLDNLSQSVERMLEYPLIESGTRDFPYGFVTTPNTLFHYLEEQEGEVVLNREFLDNLMSRLDTQPIKIKEVSEEKEKSLEGGQETTNNSEQDKKNETKLRDFSEQAQEAAPLPEVSESQPLKDLSPSQTESHSLLYFTINKPEKSIYKENYHPIKPEELNKLNHHTDIIQDAAQWYLDNLSDTTIHYFYLKGDKQYNININFQQHHFMHLTGLFPIKSNQTAVKTLHDFAEGRGEYDNILVSNRGATFQKIKVLTDLKSILETESFYFDQVEDIPKLKSLSMEKAIQSEDKDIVLALSSNNENIYPASLMELTDEFRIQIKNSLHQNVILGIFQEKDGEIHKVDINKNYIEDDGERMLSVLRNKQYEEVSREFEQTTPDNTLNNPLVDSATFTQVLDTVYNLGVPGDISKTPEEFHQAWNQYLDYAKQYNDKFDQIVAVAGEDHLLDTNSDFYKEWEQDHIYKENYHVRLQWAEERPDGPKLPFKETELISYQDFARELYKANQDFYPIHQEGMRQVTAGTPEAYIPPTKIKFDIYAPGGKVIKEGIRYDVGDETTPISQMLGLGYRRLNGQSELALMDEEILSQLETREVNKEISQEANVSARLTEEVEGQTLDTRETVAFQSSKQETKNNLLQRVEEILKEEPISDLETPEVNSSSIDYATLTPHELSEVAFQKVREYTETPERLEEYLNFMSKFPELSPRNVALIQEQWPGANAVATYNQWQSMGEVLGITSDQVFETRNTYTNKKTGRTREVVHNNLSVKTGEKSHITLFRPMMVEMIPVLDENGNQVKNGKGNPKYKRLSEATPEEKALKKEGKLKSRFFHERDSNTGLAKFATYKVFELSQTTLKPEFYPKAMPNRHYDFNMDHIRTKEVLEGLSDYANSIGVTIYQDDAKELRSAKGAFYPDEQKILLNPDNTPGEVVATTIHELAHATLHNPKFANSYKEDVSKNRRELEAEMTSYLVSKHFGLDTSEKAIRYMAIWTDNLTSLDDQQLAQSMKRIHGTVSKIVKSVEQHTKPYQLNRQVVQNQNFIQSPKKGLKV